MDDLTRKILSDHTRALQDMQASQLAFLEILRDAGITSEEDFGSLKAKYVARLDQAAAEARQAAIDAVRRGE